MQLLLMTQPDGEGCEGFGKRHVYSHVSVECPERKPGTEHPPESLVRTERDKGPLLVITLQPQTSCTIRRSFRTVF